MIGCVDGVCGIGMFCEYSDFVVVYGFVLVDCVDCL